MSHKILSLQDLQKMASNSQERRKIMSEDIFDIVNQDPLSIAERFTNKSYKEDDSTLELGMTLMNVIGQQKKKALSDINDTCHGINYEDYEKVLLALGLEKVLSYPAGQRCGDSKNMAHVYASRDGLLVSSDEWHYGNEVVVNGGNLYFCLRVNDIDNNGWTHNLRYSGSHTLIDGDWYLSGYLDVREALRSRVNLMRKNGHFISPWKSMSMGPYFMTSKDWDINKNDKNNKYNIYMNIINQLPSWVQKMIKVHTEQHCASRNS